MAIPTNPTKIKKVIPAQELVDWMAGNLVHFSFKTVNSNIPRGGVRLDETARLNLPYVSLRTMFGQEACDVGLDYMGDAAKNAGPFSQYRVAIGDLRVGATRKDAGVLALVDEVILADGGVRSKPMEVGTNQVSARQRQLLIPTEEGKYVAISPLGSSGLCRSVGERGAARRAEIAAYRALSESEQRKVSRPNSIPRVAEFSIGGSNPQNVGGRMREMHPIVAMNVPTSSAAQRMAWQLYYRGFRPRLPQRHVKAYALWLASTNEKEVEWRLATQEAEYEKIRPIWNAIVAQQSLAKKLISGHREVFGGGAAASLDLPAMDIWNQGFLFEGRSIEWKDQVAKWFAKSLREYRLGTTEDGQAVRMSFRDEDYSRISKLVAKELLR